MPILPSVYPSPTLLKLEEIAASDEPECHYPKPEGAACTDCPASVWYADKEAGLRCYCSVLHKVVWDGTMDPIVYCDGREQELAALGKQAKLSG